MRLAALNPKWAWAEAGRHGMGITFDCPHCASDPTRLFVPFENPVDGGAPDWPNRVRWQRAGDTFETLTLTPSVDCSGFGHWHGWIRDGEVTTC